MTLRTIRYDDEQWQVVPKRPTEDMLLRGYDTLMAWDARTGADIGMRDMFLAMLAVAPEPPAQEPMTDEEAEALIPPVLRGVPAGNLSHVSTGYLIAMMRAVERHHGIGKGESNEG